MRVLSLFAGIGGFDLGFEMAGCEVVGQCEIDKYCLKILEAHFPNAYRWNDIRTLTGADVLARVGPIDVICGGFPCQDISSAGKGAGLEGERSGLWFDMLRVISEVRPRWIVAENVAALRARGLDRVRDGLESLGYEVHVFGIRAAFVGAPHERKRLFVVANTKCAGQQQGCGDKGDQEKSRERRDQFDLCYQSDLGDTQSQRLGPWRPKSKGQQREFSATSPGGEMGDSDSGRCERMPVSDEQISSFSQSHWPGLFGFPASPGCTQFPWEEPRTIESTLGLTADGLPVKLALRACGNAVVPAITYAIARTIRRVERVINK